MKLIFTLAVVAMFAISSAFAADKPDEGTPLERYQGDAGRALFMCKLTLHLATAKAEAGRPQDEDSDYSGCIRRGLITAKGNLDRALRTIKKAKGQEALKSYHVAFVSALEGIRPGDSERKISYEQRQQALEGKLTEAWARFEVER